MRKKFITLMMIFASLGTMYITANADTLNSPNDATTDLGTISNIQQTRYIRYRGRTYRVNVQRVRNRRYYRPRVRYVRIPRYRFYRYYDRRINRWRVGHRRYYQYSRY